MHPDISCPDAFVVRPMKNFLTICLLTLFVAASCSREQSLSGLNEVGSYINEHPEAALAALDSLSSAGEIRGKEANAKFALLYSIALDKNGIDAVDDSLINVAVKWYRRHGSADEKLKAYYYRGRIYQNGGDNEAAMESFVLAEDAITESQDKIAQGMLYKAIAVVYDNIFDPENAARYNELSKRCYKTGEDLDKYAGSLIYSSDIYFASGDYAKAKSSLDSVKLLWDNLSDSRKINYLSSSMQLKVMENDYEGLAEELHYYVTEFDPEILFWHDVVNNYTVLGRYDDALNALAQYRKYYPGYKNDPVYYWISSNLMKETGNLKAAFSDLEEYSYLSDSLSLVIAEHDTGFIKERYDKERRMIKVRNTRTTIILVSCMVAIILTYIIHLSRLAIRRREEEKLAIEKKNAVLAEEKRNLEEAMAQYKKNYSDLKTERDTLAKAIERNPPADRQSRAVLNDRLHLLDKFFTAAILDSYEIDKKASKEIEQLVADRDKFLYTTRMTFAAAHPGFIGFLESKGLSEWEIEYCCLYAIGLKGKDIGFYINKKRHYNDSSGIRSKLGLGEHDTNLGIFLKKMLSETD